MATIDLHLHTTFSDGTWSPEELVAEAARRAVTLIAVTDHDEIGGIAPAQAVGRHCGVEVVSGVEINTDLGREEVHILGYGFPLESAVLHEGLDGLRTSRCTRLERILGRLAAAGVRLDRDRVLAIAGKGSVGRPHIAQALVEAGVVADMNAAFDRYLGRNSPAYVPRETLSPEEAIALIHRAGGFTSLAHPGKLGDPPRILRRLAAAGLDALEAYHTDHSAELSTRLERWAAQYGLVVTGGTDSHGPRGSRVVVVGSVPVPETVRETVHALLARNTQ
jgi:predicted metal-dependent phosphoesterase TrpH